MQGRVVQHAGDRRVGPAARGDIGDGRHHAQARRPQPADVRATRGWLGGVLDIDLAVLDSPYINGEASLKSWRLASTVSVPLPKLQKGSDATAFGVRADAVK